MALPGNADSIVFYGWWWDENTGLGMTKTDSTPATVTFDPVALTSGAATTPNVRDIDQGGRIKTRQRVATVDGTSAYYAVLVLSSNDPDLEPYGGRQVTFFGEPPFVVEVPYNAPLVTVDALMHAAIPSLTLGSQVRALRLEDAALITTPVPTPSISYLTSTQTLDTLTSGIETHDVDPDAHQDIRDAITAASGAVISVAGRTGDVTLTKADVGLNNVNNVADASKPVSTATQTALDAKADTSYVDTQDTALSGRISTLEGSSGPNLTDYYTKEQTDSTVDTAVAGKADTSSLAPVALSGSYADLSGTPAAADLSGYATTSYVDTADQALDGRVDALEARPVVDSPGDIGAQPAGDYASSTDLSAGLAAKASTADLAPVATSGAYGDLAGTPSIPAAYGDLSGTVPSSALPALAINDTFVVADQTAMLALTAQRGDIAIRQDRITAAQAAVYILSTDAPATLADWINLPVPADAVASVAGRTGAVTLGKADVGLGNVDNTADTAKPVSTAQQAALDAVSAAIPEAARDTIAAALVEGENVTITADDAADTITISVNIPASGYGDENAQDAVAALLAAGTQSGITFTYDDAGNALSATVSAQDWSQITGKPTFAAVATSGSYSDLTDTPPVVDSPADIGAQPADSDLTAIAALTATTNNFLQAKASAWASRTPAQVAADLAGTTSTTLAVGNDARLSDTRTPTDASVTDAKVASGAVIAESKLNLASDAAAGTASRRTLGTGPQQAAPGNDTRIVGATQKASNLSDLVSPATARTNLGLATVAATGSYTDLSNKPTVSMAPLLASWVRTYPAAAIAAAPSPPTVVVGSQDAYGGYVNLPSTSTLVLGASVAVNSVTDSQFVYAQNITPLDSNEFAPWALEFISDAPLFDLHIRAAGQVIDIYVDGQFVATKSISGGGANTYVSVNSGTRVMRHYRFESNDLRAAGIIIGNTADSLIPPGRRGPRVAVVGDSYTEGSGADSPIHAFPWQMARRLGWSDLWQSGSGGTGYLAAGAGGSNRVKYRDRIDHDVLNYSPDLVIVTGGRNDNSLFSDADVQTEAEALFQHIKQAGAVLVVVGPFASGDPDSTFLTLRDAIEAAATAAGADLFLDPFASPPLFNGTGYVGATTGSGNADVLTGSDGVHPTQDGHDAIGRWLAARIAEAWR